MIGGGTFPEPTQIFGVIAVIFAQRLATTGNDGWAFVASGFAIAAAIGQIFISLYPNVMVSSTNHAYNLTVNNAAAGHYGLVVMTVVAVLFFPIVLLYQGWSFHVFRPARERASDLVGGDATAVRALDPRLLGRTTVGAAAADGSTPRSGSGTAVAVLVQATLLARIVAKAFDGAPLHALCASISHCWWWRSWSRGGVRLGNGGRGTPCRVERAVGASPGARRASGSVPSRRRSTGPTAPRSPRSRCRASRRSRATSRATCRRSCSRRSSRSS